MLEELARLRAPATFFVLSCRAAGHPELIARILREGHELGLHGNLHLRHDEHPRAAIAVDTEEALALLAPHRPTLWRPPYGSVAVTTRELAAEHGLRIVCWTIDSRDWEAGQTAARMLERIEPELRPGAIVLMHDAIGPGAQRENPQETVDLIGPLVAAIRARGLEPGPVPQGLEPAGQRASTADALRRT